MAYGVDSGDAPVADAGRAEDARGAQRDAKSRDLPARRACDRELAPGGAEFRRRLAPGIDIPERFASAGVTEERRGRGFAVLLTGLPGAGKSKLANALAAMLGETAGRRVTLLDGDLVRRRLSSDLGFSREDRETNLRRIGSSAAGIVRHGGIAVCAAIAPYAASRAELREMVEAAGGHVEVHVSTPLEVCEAREPKGLYAKARAGLIEGFTGIDDPHEAPATPDLAVDAAALRPDAAARLVLAKLRGLGFVR